MSLQTKALLGTIWYLALVVFVYVILPGHIHRMEFDHAFASWRRNQSARNEAVLQVQQGRNVIVDLGISAVLALVLWGGGFVSYEIVRRARR